MVDIKCVLLWLGGCSYCLAPSVAAPWRGRIIEMNFLVSTSGGLISRTCGLDRAALPDATNGGLRRLLPSRRHRFWAGEQDDDRIGRGYRAGM